MSALFKSRAPDRAAERTVSPKPVAPSPPLSRNDLDAPSPDIGRDSLLASDLKPKDDPFEMAAMRTRQAVRPSGGREGRSAPPPKGAVASPGERGDMTRTGEQADPAVAMSASSSDPASQPAVRTRPAPSPAAVGDARFGEGTSANFEGTGSPSSEAEAARAAAAFRQRSSLLHNGEGVATELIPDLTMALGSMALPFGPSIAAQMAPRITQRLLPRLVLPEFNGTTSAYS